MDLKFKNLPEVLVNIILDYMASMDKTILWRQTMYNNKEVIKINKYSTKYKQITDKLQSHINTKMHKITEEEICLIGQTIIPTIKYDMHSDNEDTDTNTDTIIMSYLEFPTLPNTYAHFTKVFDSFTANHEFHKGTLYINGLAYPIKNMYEIGVFELNPDIYTFPTRIEY